MIEVVDFIIVTGIVLIVMAIISLIRIRPVSLPRYILLVIWFILLDIFVFFYAALNELMGLAYLTNFVQDGVRFLIPPLVYLYLKSIFSRNRTLTAKDLAHFIPYLVYLIVYIIPASLDLDLSYLRDIEHHLELALEKDIYGIIYFVLSLRYFYQMKSAIKKVYSPLSEKDFMWIEKFIYCFLVVLVIDFVLTISELTLNYRATWDSYVIIVALVFAIAYLSFFGPTQSKILLPDFLIQDPPSSADKKDTSLLSKAEREEIRYAYFSLMEQDKIYLRPDISLAHLATSLNIPERKVSAFFKEELQSNFFDAINSLRVAEAKRRLNSDAVKTQNIAGIGLSSGFNSKSSFYRVFKKHTGMTPLNYLKQR